ncbi:MAG: NYN domain-containing protein [Candidatus Omnitrophota bacterium]
MSLQYIIDGYNIINHSLFIQHAFKKTDPAADCSIKDPGAALSEFIRANRLCGSQKNKVTLVFDGYPDSSSRVSGESDINIVFSREETADEWIKKIVEGAVNPKNIVVVSNDREIVFSVKSSGAKVSNIQDFISRGEKPANPRRKEPVKVELNYSQIHKINQELRQLWLK